MTNFQTIILRVHVIRTRKARVRSFPTAAKAKGLLASYKVQGDPNAVKNAV